MKKEIKDFIKYKKELTDKLKLFVKDKSIPLEERWDIFISSKLGDHDNYYYNFKSLDNEDFHDGEYLSKFQNCNVIDVIEHFNDTSIENINNFKEESMNDFIYSWVFDW